MVEQLQEHDRLRAIQMEQLNQRLAEYAQRHGSFPSSSGASGGDDDAWEVWWLLSLWLVIVYIDFEVVRIVFDGYCVYIDFEVVRFKCLHCIYWLEYGVGVGVGEGFVVYVHIDLEFGLKM